MALTGQNITEGIYQGCDWLIEDTIADADNGGPKDLTGATVEWIMQPSASYATPTIKVSNVTITDAKNGVVQVTVPNTQTGVSNGVFSQNYWYAFIVTDALGNREPATIGAISVQPLPQG